MLKKVLQWCEWHQDDTKLATVLDTSSRGWTAEIEEWDNTFLQAGQGLLFDIILAANYMDIEASQISYPT